MLAHRMLDGYMTRGSTDSSQRLAGLRRPERSRVSSGVKHRTFGTTPSLEDIAKRDRIPEVVSGD
jgi:hypothetical protein